MSMLMAQEQCFYLCSSICPQTKSRVRGKCPGFSLDEVIQIWTRLRYEYSKEYAGAKKAFIHLLILSSLNFFFPFSLIVSVCNTYKSTYMYIRLHTHCLIASVSHALTCSGCCGISTLHWITLNPSHSLSLWGQMINIFMLGSEPT